MHASPAGPAATPARRSRRAEGPPLTHVPSDRPEGGRRRAQIPGSAPAEALSDGAESADPTEEFPEPDHPAHESAEPDLPAAPAVPWARGLTTAAELSGVSVVNEGYAASRAAGRRPTPAARVSVPPAEPQARSAPPSPATPPPAPPTPEQAQSEDLSDLRPHPVPRELIEPPRALQAAASPVTAPLVPVTPVAPPEPVTEVAPEVEEPEPVRVVAPPPSIVTAPEPQPVQDTEPPTDDVFLDRVETGLVARSGQRLTALLIVLVLGGGVAAGTHIAAAQDWISDAGQTSRLGALVATWAAIVLLTRRCGGRVVVIGAFSAGMAVVVAAFPEQWALAGAATSAAVAFGLLGMVLTRPQRGVRALGELMLSAFIGLVGAVVVSGYDVMLRPYRFRILVLSLALVAALTLAWRLGHGRRSIGRRGGVVIVFGVVALVASVAYAQAIRSWGSPGLLEGIRDLDRWISDTFGASPWPVEALVGFPLLVWGVTFRRRNRQGWWMCAFGALGAAGLTSSLIQTTTLGASLASTGYSVLIGAVIGLVAVGLDRVLTGGGGRKADASAAAQEHRQEPARFAPLL